MDIEQCLRYDSKTRISAAILLNLLATAIYTNGPDILARLIRGGQQNRKLVRKRGREGVSDGTRGESVVEGGREMGRDVRQEWRKAGYGQE